MYIIDNPFFKNYIKKTEIYRNKNDIFGKQGSLWWWRSQSVLSSLQHFLQPKQPPGQMYLIKRNNICIIKSKYWFDIFIKRSISNDHKDLHDKEGSDYLPQTTKDKWKWFILWYNVFRIWYIRTLHCTLATKDWLCVPFSPFLKTFSAVHL